MGPCSSAFSNLCPLEQPVAALGGDGDPVRGAGGVTVVRLGGGSVPIGAVS